MTREELRVYADYLWAGDVSSVRILGQIMQFNRNEEILRWLVKNNVRGKNIVEFFNEAEGNETRGVLLGVKNILNRIDKDKESLRIKDLK